MSSPLFFNSSVKPRQNYFFHVGEFWWKYLLYRTRLLISSPHCGTDWNYLEKRNLMTRPPKHKRISDMGHDYFWQYISKISQWTIIWTNAELLSISRIKACSVKMKSIYENVFLPENAFECDVCKTATILWGLNIWEASWKKFITLQWRQNERIGVSNHQPHDCLLSCLFRR